MTPLAMIERTPRCVHIQTEAADTRRFAFDFPVLEERDLMLTLDGVAPPRHDYVLEGIGTADGGAAVFRKPPPAGSRIALWRETPLRRVTDFTVGADLRAAVLNAELDRAVLLLQEARARVGESLHRRPYDEGPPLLLPDAVGRAGRHLVFDETGQPVTVDENERPIAPQHPSAVFVCTAPAGADPVQRDDGSALQPGDLAFDSALGAIMVFDGTQWQRPHRFLTRYVRSGGETAMRGDLSLGGHGIAAASGLNDRNVAADAAALTQRLVEGDRTARDVALANAWERARVEGLSLQAMVNSYIDPFTDETGIATAVGASYDPAGARYHNTGDGDPVAMTLISQGIGASAAPGRLRGLIDAAIAPDSALNTDITLSLSRNGGTSWADVTLTKLGAGSDRAVYGGTADLAGQPLGSDIRWRIEAVNGAALHLYRIGLQADLPLIVTPTV